MVWGRNTPYDVIIATRYDTADHQATKARTDTEGQHYCVPVIRATLPATVPRTYQATHATASLSKVNHDEPFGFLGTENE